MILDVEAILKNEPWYLSCWLLMAQLIIIAWAFRPTMLFKKFDLFGYWFGRRSWPKRWVAATVAGFVGLSAWLGFYLVLATGYFSTLVFLPASLGKKLSSRDLLTAALSFIGASAIIILLLRHNEKRRGQYSQEWLNKLESILNRGPMP